MTVFQPDPLPFALAAQERARGLPQVADLAPGPHGEALIRRFHHTAFAHCADTAQMIRFATENNGLVIYRRTEDPRSRPVIDGYLAWLEANGTPLGSFPDAMAETPLASPAVTVRHQGRMISASFLWHLCIHARLAQYLKPRSIIEISGGFGGLARLMAQADPGIRQVLVDLPETLVFAQVYLTTTLPQAKIVFATSRDEVETADCDILLVPTALTAALAGRQFDLGINVAALGEMPEAAVHAYMRFLHRTIEIQHFYSINQYGEFSQELAAGRGGRLDGVTRSSLQLEPVWDTIYWDLHGETGFAQMDPLAAPSLEVLLRRHVRDSAECRAYARRCADAAAAMKAGSGKWHRLMWEASLVWPQGDEAAAYSEYCRRLGWREYANKWENPT